MNLPMKETPCSARQPVSAEVAQSAERVAARAQHLSELLDNKLHSVMTTASPRPSETVSSVNKDLVEYPPLFADLRDCLTRINAALDAIEYAMSRTEL